MTIDYSEWSYDDKLALLDEAMGAAAFSFTALREIKFDPAVDNPKDIKLHDDVLASLRAQYPWLDAAADAIVAHAKLAIALDEEGLLD
jgi:hypothetical protein